MIYPESFTYNGIQYSRTMENTPTGEWKLRYKCDTFSILPPVSVVVPELSPRNQSDLDITLAVIRSGIAFTWATYVRMAEGEKAAVVGGDKDL